MLKKRLLFWFFCLGFGAPVCAQSVVFEQELKRYATADAQVLRGFAGALGPNPKISLQYLVTAKVVKVGPKMIDFSLYVDPEQLTGSRKTEGFDITGRLWPDSILINYSLEQVGKGGLLQQGMFESSLKLREGLHQKVEMDADWSRVRFTVQIVKVQYAQKRIQEIRATKTDMQTYAFVTGTLGALSVDMKRYQKVEDPDTLEARIKEVDNLEQMLPYVKGILAQGPFWLSEQDARTTQQLLKENGNLVMDLQTHLATQQQNIKELLAKKADRLFTTAHRELALPYYKRLLIIEPRNEKAIERFAILSVDQKQYELAARLLIQNADMMQGFSHQRIVDKTGRALEVSILGQVKEGNPEEAKPQIYLLDSLCKKFPGYRCPNLSYTKTASPTRDVYAKLMNQARVETSQDRLEQALATIQEALKTAQEGGLPSANQQSAHNLQAQVAERYVSKLVYLSKSAFEKGQDSIAMERLCNAHIVSQQYRVQIPSLSGKLVKTYAEPYVLKQEALPSEAKTKLLARYKKDLNMQTGSSAQTAAIGQTKTTKNSDCRRAQSEVNDLVAKGLKAERLLMFGQASTMYQKAVDVSKKKAECGINAAFLEERINSVAKPARYQMLLQIAEEDLEEKRYDSAVAVLGRAITLYEEANLAAQFLQEVSIPAQARNPRYAGFALYQGEQYLKTDRLDSALVMAQVAVEGKFSKTALREFSLVLGNKLAERDKQLIKRQEAKNQAESYSQGNKKLKEFEKAYLKAWGIGA